MKKVEDKKNYLRSKLAMTNECRVCFQKQAMLTSLSQATNHHDVTELIKKLIPYFKIFSHEEIKSKQICNLCLEIVINTHELRQKCAESNKKLLSRGPDNLLTDPYCRICLKETDELDLIFVARSGYSMLYAINSFCSSDVQLNDGFSQEICYNCTDVLDAARHCVIQYNKLFRSRRETAAPSSNSGAPSSRIAKVESAAQGNLRKARNHEELLNMSPFTLYEIPKVPFNSKAFGCDMCSHVFSEKKLLADHKCLMHNTLDEDKFKCYGFKCYAAKNKRPAEAIVKPPAKTIRSLANASSTSTNDITLPSLTLVDKNLLTHQMEEHNESMKLSNAPLKFACHYCSVRCKTDWSRWHHMEICHSEAFMNDTEGHLTCEICSKRVSSLYYLKSHMKKHFLRFGCPFCYDTFEFVATLNEHLLKIHHVDPETIKYQCAHCSFHINNKLLLQRHIMMHLRTFKCNICPTSYKSKFKAIMESHVQSPKSTAVLFSTM